MNLLMRNLWGRKICSVIKDSTENGSSLRSGRHPPVTRSTASTSKNVRCTQSLLQMNFCTQEKPKQKKKGGSAPKRILKIHKKEFSKKWNGYLLYNAANQRRSFFWVSAIFMASIGLSFVKLFFVEELNRFYEVMFLGFSTSIFVLYQKRVNTTLKRMVMNESCSRLKMTYFNYFGRGERTIIAPIEVMNGIGKATVFGGNVIKGGNMEYEKKIFWFNKKYIVNRTAFEHVVLGQQVIPTRDFPEM